MKNDTLTNPPATDPLGLTLLGEAIAALAGLRDEQLSQNARPQRWIFAVENLEKMFAEVSIKYELLRDRYSLVKRLNAQLADELGWLRDQCDDLCAASVAGVVPQEVDPAQLHGSRRWVDRKPL